LKGLLDPHNLADRVGEALHSCVWRGWDCIEGWSVYAHPDRYGYVINWWRSGYGERTSRDLWDETLERKGWE